MSGIWPACAGACAAVVLSAGADCGLADWASEGAPGWVACAQAGAGMKASETDSLSSVLRETVIFLSPSNMLNRGFLVFSRGGGSWPVQPSWLAVPAHFIRRWLC